MKKINKYKITLLLPCIMAMALAIGCATHSVNSTIFDGEQITVDSATQATHDFNVYFKAQGSPDSLTNVQAQIYSADLILHSNLTVLDALRLDYATNTADTNTAPLFAAFLAVQTQSTNIINLVKPYIK